MRYVRCAIAAALLSSCAAFVALAPAPATTEVDFAEIAPDRCSPALDGLFVSHAGAIDLVRGMRRAEHDHQVKIIRLEADNRVCAFALRSTQEELAHTDTDRKWALVGKLLVIGDAVAIGAAGAFGLYELFKR